MIKIMQTKRLYFLPVKLSDLQWNVNQTDDPDIKHDYLSIMEKGLSDIENELWYTIWEIRRKKDDVLVGAFRFFGPPNASFEAAVDFNIKSEYTKNGYGKEAFGCIIDFLFSFKRCSYIRCFVNREDNSAAAFIKHFGFKKETENRDTDTYELEKERRHTTLPLMLTGLAITLALKLYSGSLSAWMWAIAPTMFAIGIVTDFSDVRHRRKSV